MFKDLNKNLYLKPFKKLKDFTIDEKVKVLKFSIRNSKFGECLVAECDTFNVGLPSRFREELRSRIDSINEYIKSESGQIYIVYLGEIGKTSNIKIQEENIQKL